MTQDGAQQEARDVRVAPDGRDERIRRAYESLLATFGPQGWWPGDSPFEIIAGAVLTQNTSWRNVEYALRRLRTAGVLAPEPLAALEVSEIEALIRPSGTYRRKARTLSALSRGISALPGGLSQYFSRDTTELEAELLAIPGIGPESADSILLYAAGRGRFVVDAYARRFTERHGLSSGREPYEELRAVFEGALGRDADTLGECHALLVELGKNYCRPDPRCHECPLSYDLQTI